MEHPLSLSAAPSETPPLTADVPTSEPWFDRMSQFFRIEFDGFEDLDLGTRKEFNMYVCELFERGPSVKS